jgi:hypothetical protein
MATLKTACGRKGCITSTSLVPSGVTLTSCGGCDESTSAPKSTNVSAAGAAVATATAPSPEVAVRGCSEYGSAGAAATGTTNTPPLRVSSATPRGAVIGEPMPETTRALASASPVALPPRTWPYAYAIGESAARIR